MRYYRVAGPDGPAWAREDGDRLRLLVGRPFLGHDQRPRRACGHEEGARLLPPVAPSKIVAIGLNYKDHAAERGKPLPAEPLLFLKPPSAVIGPGDTIRRPGVGGSRRPRGGDGDRDRPDGQRPPLAGGRARPTSSAPCASTT